MGEQGREDPESFWHKLSQILLNVKNRTRAGFDMSPAWPGGYGEGNMPNRQDYHSGDLGSAFPANLLVGVCSYILCFPLWVQTTAVCSGHTLPNTCKLSNLRFLLRIQKLDGTQQCHQKGRSEAWCEFGLAPP